MAKAKKPTFKNSTANKSATKAGASDKANASNTPQVQMTINHDQVAKRAFAIWVAKGRPTGQDEQNWKEAEVLLARDMAKRA